MSFVLQRPAQAFVDATLHFTQRALGASQSVFYWVDAHDNLCDFTCSAVPRAFHRLYVREMHALDPLHIRRLGPEVTPVARLTDVSRAARSEHVRCYREYLRSFDVSEQMELLFRDARGVRAGMSVLWTGRDPQPSAASQALASELQRYVQCQLSLQPSVMEVHDRAAQLQLTPREREVAALVCRGRTNAQIARSLGVGVATVKTHLLHIFDKCGVETRAGLVGVLSHPPIG